MTLMHVRAQFQCDGCGRAFICELNNDTDLTGNAYASVFDLAIDCGLNSGAILRYVDEKDNKQPDHGLPSIQSGQHLCPGCTMRVDNYVTEDRDATLDEIKAAVEKPMFPSPVNPPDDLNEYGSDEFCQKCHHHLDIVDLIDCMDPGCPFNEQ